MKSIYNFFYFLFTPGFWTMNYPYSEILDLILNNDLDNHEITSMSRFELVINNHTYWIGNYPYAYGNIMEISGRPSRSTILKLRYRQLAHFLKERVQ